MEDSKTFKIFNWIVPIGVVLIFILIELIVRIFVPPDKLSEIALGPLTMFEKVKKEDGTWYRITGKYNITNNNFEFKEKPDPEVYRIIILGGSAAAGWPHPSDQTFSFYLEKTLNNINTNKKIEVINCAAHGFASYRVLQVFKEVKNWHPNLIIVWSGNNEFLEERNINDNQIIQLLRKIGLKIRIVQVLNKMFFPPTKLGTDIDVAGTFWKKTRQEALTLRTDNKKFASVRKIYSESIGEIAKEAKDENIQMLLMTVPVNLRDWQPNVSALKGSEMDSINWHKHYVNGRGKMLLQNYEDAITELKLASDLQPEHAETWFWLARAYENMGDYINAYKCYDQARGFDMNPFRALGAFNDSIRSLAKHFNVSLFDAETTLKKHSKNGIPGFDMFIDYVHPSKNGNLTLCYYAAGQIVNFPEFSSNTGINSIASELTKISRDGYHDEYDIQLQITRFSLCCVNHQDHSVVSIGKHLLEIAPPEVINDKNPESVIPEIKAGVDAFKSKIEADNYEFINGEIPIKKREMANKKLDTFFNTYYPYGTF